MPGVRSRWAVIAIVVVALIAGSAILLSQHSARGNHTARSRPLSSASPSVPALVAASHWMHAAQGFRLVVRPNGDGRRQASRHASLALEQALRLAGRLPLHLTTAIRQSLDNQLRCHADFAPRKPLWDLESWRPNVGFAATVEHLCNP
jgi:hypothetical protein